MNASFSCDLELADEKAQGQDIYLSPRQSLCQKLASYHFP